MHTIVRCAAAEADFHLQFGKKPPLPNLIRSLIWNTLKIQLWIVGLHVECGRKPITIEN